MDINALMKQAQAMATPATSARTIARINMPFMLCS